MKTPLETIRIGQQGKEQLLKLRRCTGIAHWNILCRWAFCASLKEKAVPPTFQQKVDGGVEMSWKVFAGELSETYTALCWLRAKQDGFPVTPEGFTNCFRAHLHRGLTFLTAGQKNKSIVDFMGEWLELEQY
ncbi:DNA sulfur modification protein DndE [Desulfobacula sp.]|uniref:DNA sulfur modification protein DndE n=1 Tax=Desulfobacula sp. TaxID=2593537 RepID=UPI001ED58C33|nr:DNA sulfur modification protein DndE [Desulfobacula sp.]